MSELENAVRRLYIQNTNTAGTRTGDPFANLADGEIAIVDRANKIITLAGGANPYTGNSNQKEIAIVQKLNGSLDYSPWFRTSDIEVLSKEAYKAPDQHVLVLGRYSTFGRNPVWAADETYRMSVEFEDRTRVAANRNPERYFISTLSTNDQAGKLALFSDFLAQVQADNYCKKFCRAYLTANGTFVASTTAGTTGTTYAFTKGSKDVVVTIGGTETTGNSVILNAWWKVSNNPQTNLISGAPVASSPVYKVAAVSNSGQVYTVTLDRVYEGETQTISAATTAVVTQITVIAAANTAIVTEFGIGLVGLRQPFGERIGRHIVRLYANLALDEVNRAIRTAAQTSSSASIQEADYGAGAWETIFDMERQSMFANGSMNHGESIRIRPPFRTVESNTYSLFSIFVMSQLQRSLYTSGNAPIAIHIAINSSGAFDESSTTMLYFNTILGLIAVAEKKVPDSTAWNASYINGGVTIAS
ncbi:MAG: hypothetical protein EBU90_01570 [Proteobacteria bacterium]|nr:hypothetical protein [Pseudomonadota bacterium]